MDRNKCIVRISGLPPFFSDKFDTTKHPNYKYTADYDKRNTFNLEKYLRKKRASEDMQIRFHAHDEYRVVM